LAWCVTPGQPYSEFNVTTDRDNILALYFNDDFGGEIYGYGGAGEESRAARISQGMAKMLRQQRAERRKERSKGKDERRSKMDW